MHTSCSVVPVVLVLALAGNALAGPCEPRFRPVLSTAIVSSGVEGLRVLQIGTQPELFIGGSFETIGGEPFNKVARYNGAAYVPIGQGLHPLVENFIGCCSKAFTFDTMDDGSGPGLFIGGDFISVNETFPNEAQFSIARWRAGTGMWETLGGLVNNDNCVADCPPRVQDSQVITTPLGPALVIGGTFSVLGFFNPAPVESKYVGMWRNGTWESMAGGMMVVRAENPEPAVVFALQMFDAGLGPQLYAAGHFTHAGGAPADSIARWTGATWQALPTGGIGPNGDEPPRGQVNAMTVFGDSLIVGGEFTLAGGVTVSHIARFDGTQWHAMGSGVDAQIRALATWDDGTGVALYAGGEFTNAGGQPASHIAKWNGSVWEPVLDGLDGSPYAMAVFDGDLYIGGYFNRSGDIDSPNLIRLTTRPCCPADMNGDNVHSVQDIFDFFAAYFSGTDERADFNGDRVVSVQDIFDFLAAYFTGCT